MTKDSHRVVARVDEQTKRDLQQVTQELGLTEAEVARRALIEHLLQLRTMMSEAKE